MTLPENEHEKTTINPTGGGHGEMPDTSLEFKRDQIILDRYKVIKLLGRGGMGSVYEVEHVNLHSHYALKFLNKNQTNDAAWRRFEIEARATNKLEHPNLIKVHDFGLLPDGQPFFIMDLVEGDTLADILKKRGRLSVDQTVKMFIQVGFALSYAHSNGIVHRDIKPSNIILTAADSGKTEDSLVKLVDFGIAKLTGQDGFNQQTLTRTGEIFGSPLYMSPEQCLGTGVDHRSDLYSLGCVMFEALTGAPPLVGDNALSTMMKHQTEAPLSLKEASLGVEFPKRIEQVVERLLAKDIQSRYQSAQLLTSDLVGLDTAQILTTALTPLPPPRAESKGTAISNPIMILVTTCIFICGFVFGYTRDLTELRKQFATVGTHVKPRIDLPSESEISRSSITMLPEGKAQKKVEEEFNREAQKTEFFSELRPDGSRIFNFPPFFIGDYSAPGAVENKTPFVVPHFKGIYFRPDTEFKRHPQLFLRFRPDDILTLNLSMTRTFANLLTDKLNDLDDLLPYITHLTSLVDLSAADSEISPKGVRYLKQFTHLKALRLERCKLSGKELSTVSCLPRLEVLHLHTVKDGDLLVKILARSTSMKVLRMTNCNLDCNDVEQLSKIPSLVELDLSKNEKVTDECMGKLPAKLESLAIIGCPVTQKSIEQIAKLKKLRLLILDQKTWKPDQVQRIHILMPGTIIRQEQVRQSDAKVAAERKAGFTLSDE